ncbi:MAG: hypothetical protein V1792_08690 [Pseudomonadota bacterium]
MIKVGRAWSWLAKKIRGSESSQRTGPPYRDLPEIPAPKARSKARYTVVLINEAGRSRQIEISPVRLGVSIAAVCGILVVVMVAAGAVGGILKRGPQVAGDGEALTQKVALLEEDLRKKEQALSVQEKRLKEMQEFPKMGAGPLQGSETERTGQKSDSVEKPPRASDSGPLTAMVPAESGGRSDRDTSETRAADSEDAETPAAEDSRIPPHADRETAASPGSTPDQTAGSGGGPQNLFAFNAEDVKAEARASNQGTLSFKLVKDRHGIRFAGYLFVYVEMEDKRGESRLYAYPKDARRGEEDLPTNFREGESVAFNKYTLVELPYEDKRPGASLAGVSVLIYDPEGDIVFQRRFDHKDLKVVQSRKGVTSGTRSSRGDERRPL